MLLAAYPAPFKYTRSFTVSVAAAHSRPQRLIGVRLRARDDQNTAALLGAACGVVGGLSSCARGAVTLLRLPSFEVAYGGAGGRGGVDGATWVARAFVGAAVVVCWHSVAKRAARMVRVAHGCAGMCVGASCARRRLSLYTACAVSCPGTRALWRR